MSFTKSGFSGIVYASDLTTSTFLMNYINGKGQFYVENSAYPVVKPGQKKPFIDNDFKSKFGVQIHTPSIYVNGGGQYTTRFNILLMENKANARKVLRVLYAFGGIDEKTGLPVETGKTEGKFKKLSIPLTDVEQPDKAPDDVQLARLSFHLTETLMILLVAYIFGIDLASSDFKACTNNAELYETLISEINAYLEAKKCKCRMKNMDEEMLAHYNENLYYNEDSTVPGKVKPKVPYYKYVDGEEVRYERLTTLHDLLKDLANDISKNKSSIGKLFTGAKQEIIDNLCFCSALKNSNTLRVYERKENEDDEEGEMIENFQVKGTFSIKQYDVAGPVDKLASLCTRMYNPKTKGWDPIESEKQLMDLYKSRIEGLVYIELFYSFGMFKEVSIGLNTRIAKMDVSKVVATSNNDDEATKLSEMRRKMTTAITEDHEDEEQDDEISRSEE